VDADDFDEAAFFRRIETDGIRALLIGRRALIALGMPVLTADYDLWIHIDDIQKLNELGRDAGLAATCDPAEARRRGRYVLEGSEHIDVMVARSAPTKDGAQVLSFDDAWAQRKVLHSSGYDVTVPSIEHLIVTKRWAMRERDLVDIQYLAELRLSQGETGHED
jgi:hypothetical protein